MTKFTRKTAKLFGATASPADDATAQGPEIGQFGSALIGTYNGTADIDTIQSLPAWSQGFIGAVTPTNQYPPLPEMTGFGKVLSYDLCYLMQQGIAEWDNNTTYYLNNFCAKNGSIYISNTNSNLNHDPEQDTVNWRKFEAQGRSHNLFDVVLKDHLLTYADTMGFTLQGEYAYKDPVADSHYGYPTFYARCLAERDAGTQTTTTLGSNTITTYNNSNGHIYFNIADKAAVDTYFNTYGVAWFYGIDEENERILMPRNNYFFKNASTSPGGLNLPGAPDIAHTHTKGTMNITGSFYPYIPSNHYKTPTGAFSQGTEVSDTFGTGTARKNAAWYNFNAANTWTGTTSSASTSNSIYGRQVDQIMVTSANGLLYVVTGNTVDEGAISLNANLITALEALDAQEQASIANINDAKDDALDDVADAKTAAIEDIQEETATVISDATAQADRAEDEADRAEAAANTATAGQKQADWTQTDTQAVDYIKNKPTDLVTLDGTQTLTNKTINAVDNTISNLATGNFLASVICNAIDPNDPSSEKLTTENAVYEAIDTISQQINNLQIAKNPNFSIIGDITLSSGNASNFTASDYLQFPYTWNFGNYTWELQFAFTTSNDVTTEQYIIDSYYGVRVAINNGKFELSISSNGTSWNIANATAGTDTVEGEFVYTVKVTFDGTSYVLSYSLDEETFTDDITVSSSTVHNATQQFVGGSPDLFGTGTAKPFDGTINLNKWQLTVNDLVVWYGMDDVGLASRANVSLNNLDDAGEARFSNLQYNIDQKEDKTPSIVTTTTSGTLVLNDNTTYCVTPSGNLTFTLPTITDTTKLHRIEVELNMSTVYSIDLGLGSTPLFFNKTAPDLSTTGVYSLLFQYSPSAGAWYGGGAIIGVAS